VAKDTGCKIALAVARRLRIGDIFHEDFWRRFEPPHPRF
jgi:hypothetical protein